MNTSADTRYSEYQKTLEAIEARTGLYLADSCVDRENAGSDERPEFWEIMLASAVSAAWFRAEEAGHDPKALGLVSP
jgi:hypothetical protein